MLVPITPVLTYVLGIVISFQLVLLIEPHDLDGDGSNSNSERKLFAETNKGATRKIYVI